MFIIDFRNKNMSKYCFSVINNSNVDIVNLYSRFTQYASNTSIYLKIRSYGDTYVDKIAIASENVSIDEDALVVKWVMGAVSTHCKKIYLQLQFEQEGEIVNQTGIVELVLADTIDVEELVPVVYPKILEQLQEQINALKEESYAFASINYSNDTLSLIFKNADNQTLATVEVSIPTSSSFVSVGLSGNTLTFTERGGTTHDIDLTDLLNTKVDKTNAVNKLYGTDISGNQTTYTVDSFFEGNVARRDTDNSITVPLNPTAGGHATSKNYVDTLIDEIEQRSDVVDVVGTYAELEAYDTSSLAPNSLIKVINDETHDNEITYYRWVITQGVGAWVYVASEGAYYTTAQIDSMLLGYYKKNESLIPNVNNAYDLGGTRRWKDLNLSGTVYVGNGAFNFSSGFRFYSVIYPSTTNTYDLGTSSNGWRDLYLTRYLNDGTNTYSIAESMAQFNPTAVDTNAEIKWSKMLSFSKTANTTFTFETAKSGCLNEYKAIITNSGSNAIALTFTGVTGILCNDDNISISSDVITLPAGVTIEVNVLNNKLIAVNFDAE